MSDAPERIWIDWREANKRYLACDGKLNLPDFEPVDAYIRADIVAAKDAEIARLREVIQNEIDNVDAFVADNMQQPGEIGLAMRLRAALTGKDAEIARSKGKPT